MADDRRPRVPRRLDPWQAAVALAAVPLVLHSLGTPLGEPFADDFLFLHRELLGGPGSWLDGGGSPLYWRPLGRQAYFGALGAAIVAAPWIVAALHVALLAAAAVLVQRALRGRVGAPWAAVAATFPLLLGSARMLIAWPSHFQDVGAIAFAALAIHEAAAARLGTMLAALLASLLCKEVGVVTALLLPWLPGGERAGRAWRLRAMLAVAAVVAAWAAAYAAVTARAGVGFAHQFGAEAAAAGTPLPVRVVWALSTSVRSAFSLPAEPGRWDAAVLAGLVALLATAAVTLAASAGARRRLRAGLPLVLWGLAWFAAATVPLVEVYPTWSGQRCVFASLGLGIALAGLLAAASRWLLAPLVALRLVTFAASPAGSSAIAATPPEAGGEFDFRHLARLQWFVRHTHTLLGERFPELPPGSVIGYRQLPLQTRHALAGDLSLQVWYRDTTLHWRGFEEHLQSPGTPVAAFIEYQPRGDRPLALVEGEAMRGALAGLELMRRSRWAEALEALERAEAAQRDRAAAVFLGSTVAKRAVCAAVLGRAAEAESLASRALELWPENPDSRVTLAELRLARGEHARAETLLVEQLRLRPADAGAAGLLERVRRDWLERRARPAGAP
jgi:tetratricopeptide (TPR) repeat protein